MQKKSVDEIVDIINDAIKTSQNSFWQELQDEFKDDGAKSIVNSHVRSIIKNKSVTEHKNAALKFVIQLKEVGMLDINGDELIKLVDKLY